MYAPTCGFSGWVLRAIGACLAVLLLTVPLAAQPASSPAEVLAPLLNAHTVVVARLDLSRVDVAAAMQLVRTIVGPGLEEIDEKWLQEMEGTLRAALQTFREAGIRELYGALSLADIPDGGGAVAKLPAPADAQRAALRLRPLLASANLAAEAVGDRVWIGGPQAISRRETITASARPDLLEALQAARPATLQIVLSPGPDHRRALREMVPRLPEVLGGGPGTVLVEGVQWLHVAIDLPPQLGLQLTLKARDAQAASELRTIALRGLDWLGQQQAVTAQLVQRPWAELRPHLEPVQKTDALVVDLSESRQTAAPLIAFLTPAIQASRQAARRSGSMNQLKQIGLAMHNYHDTFGRFPPQAIRSKDGKPLLSWRVALLPFLEHKALYDQFHLDEPWDSPHNRQLLEKMPAIYADPLTRAVRKEPGLTPFVVPLTRVPPAVHVPLPPDRSPSQADRPKEPLAICDVPDGVPFTWITDGTSNTILVLKAAPQAAVPWTKPEDWLYDPDKPLQGLLPEQGDQIALTAFADGSVRVISPMISPDVFRLLILMNDGKPVRDF